jgi:hypothetical protein
MSDPDGRYDAHPGPPLSEQPTEVVPPLGRVPRHTTAAGHGGDTVAGYWGRDDDRDSHRDDHRDTEPTPDPYAGTSTRPDYRDAPVVVRRADTLAGLLLLLAGIAAGVSLLVVWVHGGSIGLDLVRAGVDDLGAPQRLADRDTWEPLAIVSGGVVLFLLGLLMYVPAKTHRFLGVLALLVSLVVAAGVLVPLAGMLWDVQRWAVGFWFAAAVGGLGFLGALKALMTHPRRRW